VVSTGNQLDTSQLGGINVTTRDSHAADSSRVTSRSISRRALLVAATPVALIGAAAVGSLAFQISRQRTAVEAPGPVEPQRPLPAVATPPPTEAPARLVATPGTPVIQQSAAKAPDTRELANAGVPDDMVLIASPRLPVSGVGPGDPWRLMTGGIANWADVGSAVSLRVRPVGLKVAPVTGIGENDLFDDYATLAQALRRDPSAVALVPREVPDFRVQTLLIGGDDPLDEKIDDRSSFRIGVIGDIVPGRNVHLHMEQYGDFTRPFLRVAPLLRSFDLTIANLEGNLSNSLPQPSDSHSFSFVSNPLMIEGMTLAGIDALTLANNHTVWNSENWGVQGLLDTIEALESYKMPYFGAGRDISVARKPLLAKVHGVRVAFLGIDGVTANYEVEPGTPNGVLDFDAGATADRPGTNPLLAWQVMEDIAAAKTYADVVIPYFHFGAEYVAVVPGWASNVARMAIDAGASMVISNHPHVIQGMEIYAGKPIVYSPGNFILDQMWAAEVRSGYVLEIDFRGADIVGLRFHGIEIEDFHQPRPMSSGEQAALMDRFWSSTDRLATRDGLPV
jgi:poly-gamma-glutamate capsule biosynthesis protein CapA/YwtB (metallophosphatase superfamily)